MAASATVGLPTGVDGYGRACCQIGVHYLAAAL